MSSRGKDSRGGWKIGRVSLFPEAACSPDRLRTRAKQGLKENEVEGPGAKLELQDPGLPAPRHLSLECSGWVAESCPGTVEPARIMYLQEGRLKSERPSIRVEET